MARRPASETDIRDPGTRAQTPRTVATDARTRAQAPATTRPAAPAVGKAEDAKKARPQAEKPRVLVVRLGRVLMWPNGTVRGKPGYCVAADDPFIAGFEGVLKPGGPGDVPEPITEPVYVRKLAELKRKQIEGRSAKPDRREHEGDLDAKARRRREYLDRVKNKPKPPVDTSVTDDSIPDVEVADLNPPDEAEELDGVGDPTRDDQGD